MKAAVCRPSWKGLYVSCLSAHPARGLTKSVGSLSAEQNGGHAQPGRVGHEGEAVLRWHRDQGVGCGVLRSAETMSRGSAQVSRELLVNVKLHNGCCWVTKPESQSHLTSEMGC